MASVQSVRERDTEDRRAVALAAAIKDGLTCRAAIKADLARRQAKVGTELKWIETIRPAILAVLVLQRLVELVEFATP